MSFAAKDGVMPVVVIHGALRGAGSVWPMVTYLRRHGLAARAFAYASRHASLADHAAALSSFLEAWLRDHQGPVGFVTHSMGALVVRRFFADFADQVAQARVFMIAPPNRGAALADKLGGWAPFDWLYGHAAGELRSERVQALPWLPNHAVYKIVVGGRAGGRGWGWWLPGQHDGMVTAAESQAPIDVASPCEFLPAPHGLLPYLPATWRQATMFLRESTDRPIEPAKERSK